MTFFSGVQVTCALARLYSAWPDFMRALARSAKSPGESAIGPTLCRSARIPLPGVPSTPLLTWGGALVAAPSALERERATDEEELIFRRGPPN